MNKDKFLELIEKRDEIHDSLKWIQVEHSEIAYWEGDLSETCAEMEKYEKLLEDNEEKLKNLLNQQQ